jgi:hypothetical protein
VSRHDKINKSDDQLDDNVMDDELIQAEVNKHLAAVPYHEVCLPNESKAKCMERLCFYFLEKYRSFASRVKEYGNIELKTKILIFPFLNLDDHQTVINVPDEKLKPSTDASTPTFYNYDPVAIKKSINDRTLLIRDIPLHFKKPEQDLRSYFRHFGLIDSVKTHIPRNS